MHVSFEWLESFGQQDFEDASSQALMPCVNELVDESLLGLGIYGHAVSKCCLHAVGQSGSGDGQFAAMSGRDLERLNRLFENGLRANSLVIRISTVQGIMYWLESIALGKNFDIVCMWCG